MELNKTTIDDTPESTRVSKEEDRVLKEAAVSQRTHWYQNISTWISMLALLFSFGTAYYSHLRSRDQDLQNKRTELRSILQRLAVLSKEFFEVPRKYADDPAAIPVVQSSIANESDILARQAADIMKILPPDQVSSAEWLSIAMSLEKGGKYDLAKQFIDNAMDSAKTLTEKVAAVTSNARFMFFMGSVGEGRNEYQKALDIVSQEGGHNESTKGRTNIDTYLNWAYSEAYAGFKDEAKKCLTKAEGLLAQLQLGPDAARYKADVDAVKRQILLDGAVHAPEAKIEGGRGVRTLSNPKPTAGPKVNPRLRIDRKQKAGRRQRVSCGPQTSRKRRSR